MYVKKNVCAYRRNEERERESISIHVCVFKTILKKKYEMYFIKYYDFSENSQSSIEIYKSYAYSNDITKPTNTGQVVLQLTDSISVWIIVKTVNLVNHNHLLRCILRVLRDSG